MKENFKKEYQETIRFFRSKALRIIPVKRWEDVRAFLKSSTYRNWIYVILFSDSDWIYSFGTASKDGSRLKKTGLFQRKLTGKYDRRGDYLMLKAVYGSPLIHLLEIENAVEVEQKEENKFTQAIKRVLAFRGFQNHDRDSITREVFCKFQTTDNYRRLEPHQACLFKAFIEDFYLAKLKHPNRGASFHYGDCLEPKFLGRTLGRKDIEEVVELALDVKF